MIKLSEIHLTFAQVRKERGISQEQIASELAVEQGTVSLYENGRRAIPLETIELWAKLLEVEITITPQGYEPLKEPDCEKRDLEEWGRLKRRRNYLIAELRSMMAVEAMRAPEFQVVDEESGESQFWPYAIHGYRIIGLVQTRYDHPSQRYLAVEYTGEEVNIYRFGSRSSTAGSPRRAYLTEDDFLTLIGNASPEKIEVMKSTIFRAKASSPEGVELVNPEGFPIKSLWEMQESHTRFAAVRNAVVCREDYLTMENELLRIEGRLDELLLDNRLGNGMPNPAFKRWSSEDEQAVSVPLYSAERIWRWTEEGVSWVDDLDCEVGLRLGVDPELHEGYETLLEPNGSRTIGAIGPDKAPAIFKVNPAKPELIHRIEVKLEELTDEESERYDGILESARELSDLRSEKESN